MTPTITLTEANPQDAWPLSRLIAECPPLDNNSVYCNLLQCSHFAQTCVAAKQDNELLGFISAYLIPGKSNTLFVWQVAVDNKHRGKGLASKMLMHILTRKVCKSVEYLETSITKNNHASRALFEGFANKHGLTTHNTLMFDKEIHFSGSHESEYLLRIGPLNNDIHQAPQEGSL
jgi:L-2,4-diaminobutyric acid acetyltransferase